MFDFDAAACRELAEVVRTCYAGESPAVEVVEYHEISPMAYAFRDKQYDMAFMAVDGMLAVEAARLVRESAPDCPLFLVSGNDDYALEGYRLRALDYLVRPVTPRRIRQAAARIIPFQTL